jgi:hypothetical protein
VIQDGVHELLLAFVLRFRQVFRQPDDLPKARFVTICARQIVLEPNG